MNNPALDTDPAPAPGAAQVDLRVGILGFGLRSGLWRHAHHPGAGSQVVAVCDPAPRGRDAAAKEIPGVRVVAELEQLLALDLDAVLILTPDHLHAEHAEATLRAGVATFLEKPIATTTQDADRILATAQETGTRLYVGHNMRHMPVIQLMRQAIQDGAIGEVRAIWCRHFVSAGGDFYFKDWHADRRHTTGLLLQKGAHDIDVIHWLAGGYTRAANAVGALSTYGDLPRRDQEATDLVMPQWYDEGNWPPATQRDLNPVVDVEDISMANLVLDNGVLASYQQCHFSPDYWRNYTVIGSAGRMENSGDGPGATIRIWQTRADRYRDEADQTLVVPEGDTGGHGGADPLLIAEFLRFAREGGPTMTSPVAARHAVAAGVAATTSVRGGGGLVTVPSLDPTLEAYFANDQI